MRFILDVKVVILLMLSCLFSHAMAAPVTLVATGYAHSSPQSASGNEDAVLQFTYDDQTLDSNPDPQYGLYENPILSGTFDFGDSHFVFDPSSASAIELKLANRAGSNVYLDAIMIGDLGEVLDLHFVMETYWKQDSTDLLSTFPYIKCDEVCTSFFTVSLGEQSQSYHFHMSPREFSVVPIPAAAWLFAGALGVLGVVRRRSAA
jgi:hypothetical protein